MPPPPTGVDMPMKKKDPRMRALQKSNASNAGSGSQKYFDSADYEVAKQRAQNPEAKVALREAAGKEAHALGSTTSSGTIPPSPRPALSPRGGPDSPGPQAAGS